ncbi:sensor histidine kinase [Desulfosporosinus sp. BICA1-9]|uniref:sensor histidine kinase n=1 Tax=Desulfosporosinus sp. BICA1-9 TaxID=1531958 RepID=UPI00054B8161|nr:histidine kinase [Desulfosporosinus sp. BICA1-9]KJS47939.1 MAG: hypothetical protein VR66_16845 [Peptococcaceae bacterium BRH_c23]KJS85606.1 MAG: hypothetical protein JL57_18575 [Desulfosporosinus sp. BICA1-9]HBW34122.1 two-component sensor histidine kinase [Desulfosporosinus sp.]
MFIWLSGVKIVLYSLVFIRVLQKNPISILLVLIALALLVSGCWRSYYKYNSRKVNIITLLLDLILTIVFSLFCPNGGFDKLFVIYLTEGTAILPKPFFIAYAILTTAVGAGTIALFELREYGQLEFPGIGELLLYVFIFGLVFSERRQREQRLAYKKLTKELRYSNLQLQKSMELSESLASEAERRQIVGEIHDSLGYHLTGLVLTLEAGKKLTTHDVEAGKTYWDKAIKISRTALQSVRELVLTKKESYFEFDLSSRLMEMVQEVRALTGLELDLELDIETQAHGLSGQLQFNMYRIFQEAVTNTLRHAKADRAQISISNKELLYFSYWDNGCGTNRIEAGNGLQGMKDRISALGGTVSFQSGSGIGFKIEGCIDRRGENNE